MDRVQRHDRLTQNLDGFDAATGMLLGRAVLAKTGVYRYLDIMGGQHTEFVPPETLRDPAWLESLRLAPVSLGHPPTPITADNADQHVVGAIGDTIVFAEGANLSPIKVMHARAVDAVRDGVRELSCGYTCTLDLTPGEWNGQKYDAVQRNRRANHVAIVDRGRHGPTVRLTLDGEAQMLDAGARQEDSMPNPTTDPKIDAKCDKCDEWAKKYDALKGEFDAMKDKAKDAKKDADDASVKDAAFAAGRARAALEVRAQQVCGEKWNADGKTDRQIHLDMLAALKVTVADSASDVYVQARLDAELDNRKGKNGAATAADEFATRVRDDAAAGNKDADAKVKDHLKAIAEMQARQRGEI